MARRGEVCIAGYDGADDVAWRVGRNMLRFRPIAPKPAPATLATPAATVSAAPVPLTGGTRPKRKATTTTSSTTTRGNKRGRKPQKAAEDRVVDTTHKSSSSPSSSSSAVISADSSLPPTLLTLLPESPDQPPKQTAPPPPRVREAAPVVVVLPTPVRSSASWVTVEGVTGTWQDGEITTVPSGLACDESPAFVSDQWGRVTWTNASFQKMVVGKETAQVRAGLVTTGAVPAWGTCAGFTCRVRVRYECKRRGRGSLASPCDVWRLDGGSYVWRLDIKAALSLGLGVDLN